MLVSRSSVPKVRKSTNNESKHFLGYFGHAFVFFSNKAEFLIRIFLIWLTVVGIFFLSVRFQPKKCTTPRISNLKCFERKPTVQKLFFDAKGYCPKNLSELLNY